MKYAGVTDGDLYHGHVRFDVNISISTNPAKPGIRTEVKNLNSFRSVENAVAYEVKRQTEVLGKGDKVIQETRGWDEAKQKTTSQRGKEEAHDYRYMPEPDIPPTELNETFIKGIASQMPEMPSKLRHDLGASGLSPHQIETILDDYETAQTYIKAISEAGDPKVARVWSQAITNNLTLRNAIAQAKGPTIKSTIAVSSATLAGEISSNQLNQSLEAIILEGKTLEGLDFKQTSDETEIEKIVNEAIKENPKVVTDIKAGQEKAIGFLVGQVMGLSKGQANPALARKIIKQKLEK